MTGSQEGTYGPVHPTDVEETLRRSRELLAECRKRIEETRRRCEELGLSEEEVRSFDLSKCTGIPEELRVVLEEDQARWDAEVSEIMSGMSHDGADVGNERVNKLGALMRHYRI